MPPCKCTLARPQKPWSQWPWIVAYQQKEKKDGAGRRSLYPKCNEHGNPLHKFTDGTNTVPSELKPKYKSRKPRGEPDDTEQTPTSTLLSKRKAEDRETPTLSKRRAAPNKDDADAAYQPRGSQVPHPDDSQIALCMLRRADRKAKSPPPSPPQAQPQSQPQSQPESIQATKPKDHFNDQLTIALNILEREGVQPDSRLWARVREAYMKNPVGAIMKRGSSMFGTE